MKVTNDRSHALADLSERLLGVPVGDLGTTPFALVGTVGEMAAQFVRQAEQLGITRYVVREPAMDPIVHVLSLLDDGERKGHRDVLLGAGTSPTCVMP